MMARRGVLAGLTLGMAALLAGCNPFEASRSYRFRMTVEGAVTGSAVYEVLATKTRMVLLAEEKPGGSLLRGEALVLERSDGPVFVLLKRPDSGNSLAAAVTYALAPDLPQGGHENFWTAMGELGGWFGSAKAELPRADWPLMVRFRDINDPRSVERVDPAAVGVKRIVLETTSDEVTTGIEKRLGWLRNGGLTLDPGGGPTVNPTFAQTVRQNAFSSEIPQ